MSYLRLLLMLLMVGAVPSFATVVVTSPSNGASVSSSAQFTATANSTCSGGVASMGVYIDNQLEYVEPAASLNTSLAVASGKHNVAIQEWDYCGGSTNTALTLTGNASSGVSVASPANGATVSTTTPVVASATTGCQSGVASMGVYVDSALAVTQSGATLNKSVSLSAGSHNVTVQSWDNCGGSAKQALSLSVAGTQISNLQALPSWDQWGELAPVYAICTSCSGVSWNMTQHVSSPSLSGNATKFTIGGSVPYSDVLWSNKVLGQGSTLGITDTARTILPNIHNMTVDGEIYVSNLGVTQDIELDVNLYLNGVGMEWGTECNHLADGDWDIWNNVNAKWVSTGVACTLNNGAWNHVVLQVQRESNNDLLYQTITVNGVAHNINQTVAPFAVSSSWYGLTVNYQMDGNYQMASNTTYVDDLNLTYW